MCFLSRQQPLKHIKNIKSSKAFSFSKRQAFFRYPVGGGISYSSLPGLGKVAGPYAPSFGALVPLRLCRAKACLEDYYMICLLLRPPIKTPLPLKKTPGRIFPPDALLSLYFIFHKLLLLANPHPL